MAVGLIGVSTPSAFAQSPSASSSIVFEFTTTLDLQDTAGSKVHTVSKSQYGVMMNEDPFTKKVGPKACTGYVFDVTKVTNGDNFCVRLRYLGGRLVEASGIVQGGSKVEFKESVPPPAKEDAPDMASDHLEASNGTPFFKLRVVGAYEVTNGEEAMGCDQGRRPRLTLSYDEVRNLNKLHRQWSEPPFEKDFGETCKGTVTVEVQAR
jgi:hypothetical protein